MCCQKVQPSEAEFLGAATTGLDLSAVCPSICRGTGGAETWTEHFFISFPCIIDTFH